MPGRYSSNYTTVSRYLYDLDPRAALAQENQARRAIEQHQPRLEALTDERARLISWLAQLEADNATCPNSVCVRWLLDGGFADAANVTYLIEMGYDLYAMAHNGKTTPALLKLARTEYARRVPVQHQAQQDLWDKRQISALAVESLPIEQELCHELHELAQNFLVKIRVICDE